MTADNNIWVALLRGIGPATHRVMPMSELRRALQDAGLGEVRTVLATGNLIFTCSANEQVVRGLVSKTIRSFGLENEVFLRQPDDLRRIAASNPFADATVARPGKVLVLFFEKSLRVDAASLFHKLRGPERIELADREVLIDYIGDIAGSKLTTAFVERLMGASATARNWNSVMRLSAIAR